MGAGGHYPHLAKVGEGGGVLQLQSRHNSHTSHCYAISFGAGKRLDVIIIIMKRVQTVSCLPR